MPEYTRHDREQLKNALMKEMLETWQTTAALAVRAGVSPKMADSLLRELRDDRKLIMRRCRVDGHNETSLYKMPAYDWVLNFRVERRDLVSEV